MVGVALQPGNRLWRRRRGEDCHFVEVVGRKGPSHRVGRRGPWASEVGIRGDGLEGFHGPKGLPLSLSVGEVGDGESTPGPDCGVHDSGSHFVHPVTGSELGLPGVVGGLWSGCRDGSWRKGGIGCGSRMIRFCWFLCGGGSGSPFGSGWRRLCG